MFVTVVILVSLLQGFSFESIDEESDLLLAFVVNRHGDRTPNSISSFLLSEDHDRDVRLSYPFGDSELTNEGKERGYSVGKYLRKRYGKLLSDIYFKDEIYLRATESDRTQMTLLTALAAIYPPKPIQRWNHCMNWQPIPYFVEDPDHDFLNFLDNCPTFNILTDMYAKPMPTINIKYGWLLKLLTENTINNFIIAPGEVYSYNDLIESQIAIGVSPPEWIAPYLNELHDAASEAMAIALDNVRLRRLLGGVLLNEFFKVSNQIISGQNVTQRVRIFSSHDMNVAVQLAAARVKVVAPLYGAVFSLELRQLRESGNYIVLPVYLPQAGNSTLEVLSVDGCSSEFCPYSKFKELSLPYLLTNKEREILCGKLF